MKQLVFLFSIVAMATAARCDAANSAVGEKEIKARHGNTGRKYLNRTSKYYDKNDSRAGLCIDDGPQRSIAAHAIQHG